MPKFNANLSMMFNEVDFLDRFARRGQGRLQGRRVPVSLHLRQEPAGRDRAQEQSRRSSCSTCRRATGTPATAAWPAIPRATGEFQEGVGKAIDYALALGCKQIHCMAGLKPRGVNDEKMRETYIANLRSPARSWPSTASSC